jgi:hypothetical protein
MIIKKESIALRRNRITLLFQIGLNHKNYYSKRVVKFVDNEFIRKTKWATEPLKAIDPNEADNYIKIVIDGIVKTHLKRGFVVLDHEATEKLKERIEHRYEVKKVEKLENLL